MAARGMGGAKPKRVRRHPECEDLTDPPAGGGSFTSGAVRNVFTSDRRERLHRKAGHREDAKKSLRLLSEGIFLCKTAKGNLAASLKNKADLTVGVFFW